MFSRPGWHGDTISKCPMVREPDNGVIGCQLRQFTKSEGITIRPIFARIFPLHPVSATLDEVKAPRPPTVVSTKQPAADIELKAEIIATSLGKNLKGPRGWVIPPDHAACEVDSRRARGVIGAGDAAG